MKSIHSILLVTVLALTGCFSLGRDEPSQQHFVLGGNRLQASAPQAERLAGLAIGLRQVNLAEYLDSPLIVVRYNPHQIRFSEFNRWGENLDGGFNRAIALYLADRAPFEAVDVVPWAPRAHHDYLIQIHLLRFEGVVVEEALEGEAYMLANWEIIRQSDGAVLSRGITDYRQEGWTVGDYVDLVTRLDAGVGELSDDLIAGLEEIAAAVASSSAGN